MLKRKENPEWLERLQNNSWQVEMLIAGSVVYTLYQLPTYIRTYFISTYEQVGLSDFLLSYLLSSYLLTRLLLIGFTANLILRAIWVAYIGIYSSFPQGINQFHPKFSGWYALKKEGQLEPREKLDRLESACNITYSLAILMCLITSSIFILMLVLLFLIGLIPGYNFLDTAAFKYSFILVLFFIVFGTFERLTYQFFKQRPRALKWSQRVFKVLDYLSLAFIYKGAWLTLASNIKAWKIQMVIIFYFLLGFLLSINQIGDYLTTPGFFHYDVLEDRDYLKIPVAYEVSFNNYYNQLPEKNSFTLQGCISSDIVQDGFMWVFVPYWKSMDVSLKKHFEKYKVPLNNKELGTLPDGNFWEKRQLTDSLHKAALADFFTVIIDGDTLQNVQWFEHQITKTAERGFINYINTDSLAVGEHLLNLRWTNYNWRGEVYESNWLNIPFWKE
jgi:hypothetical protein